MVEKTKKVDQEVRSVKSAERVLDIFCLLVQYPNGLKLRDIAESLSIPASSLHAILNTMKQRGFIERAEGSMLYRLGRNLHQLVAVTSSEDDLMSLAVPVMEKIQRESKETVSLSVLVGNEIAFIGKRSSSSVIQVVNALGSRLPAHASGSGKVILSFLPENEIDRIFPQEILPGYTANTITSKTELKKALEKIRRNGFAFDDEESIDGVWAVAGCIRSLDNSPLAATSIVVPTMRVTADRIALWRELIIAGAAEITQKLGIVAGNQDDLGRRR